MEKWSKFTTESCDLYEVRHGPSANPQPTHPRVMPHVRLVCSPGVLLTSTQCEGHHLFFFDPPVRAKYMEAAIKRLPSFAVAIS